MNQLFGLQHRRSENLRAQLKVTTFLSIKYAKSEKVTLQRPGKLCTTIYHSGSINHSSTAKKLDSQA